MRILALDVGEKRIGVALSDPLGMLATPLTTIQYQDEDFALEEIRRLVDDNEASRMVVGMPLTMSGKKGPQAKLVAGFIERLKQTVSVPIVSVDERLSSVQAERMLRESGT